VALDATIENSSLGLKVVWEDALELNVAPGAVKLATGLARRRRKNPPKPTMMMMMRRK
jgi:hypothetical protein